jgi:hypothetical protein
MAELLPHLFLFFAFIFAVLLFGVCVFSFSAPLSFAQWFTPWYFLSRSLSSKISPQIDRIFAFCWGGASLMFLMFICFSLGGFLFQFLRWI